MALAASEGVTKDGEIVKLVFTTRGAGDTKIGLEDVKAWEQKTSHAMAVAAQGGTLAIKESAGGMSIPMPFVIAGGIVLVIIIVAVAMKRKA